MRHVWGTGIKYSVLLGRPDRKRALGTPMFRGRIILKWIFRNWNVE
jgi:hypothetical protein